MVGSRVFAATGALLFAVVLIGPTGGGDAQGLGLPKGPSPGTAGGVCRANGGCDAWLRCLAGVCAAYGGEGQVCGSGGVCQSQLTCRAGFCVRYGGENQSCGPGSSCSSGLSCSALGLCEQAPPALPRGGELQACRDASDPAGACNAGLACTQLGVCMTPPPAGGLGQACRPGKSCDSGLSCNDLNVCASSAAPPRGGNGQLCRPDASCNDASSLCIANVCVPQVGKVVAKGALGQTCRDGSQCASGTACRSGACLPTGMRVTVPTGNLGQKCGKKGTCSRGLACSSGVCLPSLEVARNTATKGTAGVWKPPPFSWTAPIGGKGQLCHVDGRCDKGLTCELGRCEADRGGKDQSCHWNGRCNDSSLECVHGTCRDAGQEGQYCHRSMFAARRCSNEHLFCSGASFRDPGHCKHKGLHGETCAPQNFGVSSAPCDVGLECDQNKCLSPGDRGASCKGDHTCNTALACTIHSTCSDASSIGGRDQPCAYNYQCAPGLACEIGYQDWYCRQPGAQSGPCRSSQPQCDANLSCKDGICEPPQASSSSSSSSSSSADAGAPSTDNACSSPVTVSYCAQCTSTAFADDVTACSSSDADSQANVWLATSVGTNCTLARTKMLRCEVACDDGTSSLQAACDGDHAQAQAGAEGCTPVAVQCEAAY